MMVVRARHRSPFSLLRMVTTDDGRRCVTKKRARICSVRDSGRLLAHLPGYAAHAAGVQLIEHADRTKAAQAGLTPGPLPRCSRSPAGSAAPGLPWRP